MSEKEQVKGQIIDTLGEWDMWWLGYAQLSAITHCSIKDLRSLMKELIKENKVELVSIYEDCEYGYKSLSGSGYIIKRGG